MLGCEFVIAAVLITSPKDSFKEISLCEMQNIDYLVQVIRPSMLSLAMDSEILDTREHYFFAQQAMEDLKIVQDRYESYYGKPRLSDCDRFPDRKTISFALAMNRKYKEELDRRLEIDLYHTEEVRNAIIETNYLYHIMDNIRDCQCEYYFITVRREALHLIRELIGPEAYYSGQLPPSIPFWHLSKN